MGEKWSKWGRNGGCETSIQSLQQHINSQHTTVQNIDTESENFDRIE